MKNFHWRKFLKLGNIDLSNFVVDLKIVCVGINSLDEFKDGV